MLKTVLTTLIAAPVVVAIAIGGVLTFTGPKTPPPIDAIESANAPLAAFAREQPAPQYLTARDGEKLAYRFFAGKPGGGVAVVVHGSSGTTVAMQGISKTLSLRGVTVYSVDLRGHGLSKGPEGRLGDIVHRGQYEEDLADFAALAEREHPAEKRLLLGHSMGGAIVLRTAGFPAYARNFDAYLALSPVIAPGSALDQPNQGWVTVSIPRIVTLSILNGFGISALDHLPVLAMAVPPGDNNMRPKTYSHALLASANPPRDWQPAYAAITAPARVLIGTKDELFRAEMYPGELGKANANIPVTLLPEVTHMGIVYQPQALEAVAMTAEDLLK
ncbi:alpha/beta fold hydrolase [Asticcacaulis sp. AC402]|uniref:alpha/beta fold hydrolase n=1 Tax=Asticcacaulis sp. AC402 TaxID=1282361 RepID=UPI000417907C|nr:alpha/beta fold hydrolase [Asticcacaulis sp. AC402]